MALNNKNTYTILTTSMRIKIRIHWILQIIGGCFSLYGIPMQIYNRQIRGRTHFDNTHAITGINVLQ